MATLPQGTVTFLFTDIEGSTRLVQAFGDRYAELLETHQQLLRASFAGGVEISTEGDSFFVAFGSATAAVEAAVAAQRAVAGHQWPAGASVRVRMGLHTGQPSLGGDNYVGFDVHRAARIAAAGRGGQVLLSESTHGLVRRDLPEGVTERDLGEHRLKDLSLPEHLFQLVIPGLPADFPPLRALDPARTNLPPQLTSFIGRERDLAALRELCLTHRLVTVIGTGGTGKTRLMLHAAAELNDEYTDGVWLVELAPIGDAALVPQAVSRALGAIDEPGRDTVDVLVDFLRAKSLLLLIDNCEHVIGEVAALVHRLVTSCPGLVVLASSREALAVPGESVYQLASLGIPARIADVHEDQGATWLAEAAASDAVRLFVDRATAIMPTFALTPPDARAVVEVCRRLDGIPLAIELAAARVTLLSVQEIASRLGDRFRLLTGGRRTALPRQQTLEALIDWSWQLLDQPQQRLLRRLSVFAGGWTLEAASAVTRLPDEPDADDELETLDMLGHLVDRSLVLVDRAARSRYRLLETIRAFARERLVEAQEVTEIHGTHLAFFLRLAEEAEPDLRGPQMAPALARLDADADNLRTAQEWAFEADPERALRLSLALSTLWRSRDMAEGQQWLSRAAALVKSMPAPAPEAARERDMLVARVLAAAATASWLNGSGAVGLPWAREAVEVAQRTDDVRARYEALGSLVMSTVFSGGEAGIMERANEVVRLAESVGDWWTIGFTRAGLAQWAIERGDVAEGEAMLASAMAAADRTQNPTVIAFAALAHARVSGFAGRLAEAREWFERTIGAYRSVGDAGLALVARSDLAHVLRRAGSIDEAEAIYRETLHEWLHAGNRGAIANQLESFAFIFVKRGELERAARLFGAAEAIREVAQSVMLYSEREEYDQSVGALRATLDRTSLDAAWAEGRRLSTDEAASLAISR